MASLARSLNQDNDLGIHFTAGAKLLGKKTGGTAKPRRPLQDLNCNNMENLGKSLDIKAASKPTKFHVTEKSKQEKMMKNGGRRALGDLTNISKPSQKNSSLKLPSVTQKEEMVPGPTEEGWLHDHGECMKAQKRNTMDVDYFLETVGLGKGCSTPALTPKVPPVMTRVESPTKLGFGALSPTFSTQLESPMMRRNEEDIEAVEFGIEWEALDFSGFKMED